MAGKKWEVIQKAREENKHELVLTGPEISKLIQEDGMDNSLYELSNLNYLEFSKTCLATVPDAIGSVSNLSNLVLHSNALTALPKEIGQLTKLKVLDVSRNKIEELPSEIGHLANLMTLNASWNQLKSLPKFQTPKLNILDLSHNEITEFGNVCSSDLALLQELRLKKNHVSELSSMISNLSSLKLLDLSENELSQIPGELSDCSKLKDLDLKGNKISDRNLRKLIDKNPPKQILDYVRNHCPKTAQVNGTKEGEKESGGAKKKKGKSKNKDSKSESAADDEVKFEIKITRDTDSTPVVVITDAVKDVRPFIVCCIIRNVSFNVQSFRQFIQLQTQLHDTVCDKRNIATIATHDLSRLGRCPLPESDQPPSADPVTSDGGVNNTTGDTASPCIQIRYDAKPPDQLRIFPLMRVGETTAAELYTSLVREAEILRKKKKRNTYSGIHRYLHLLEGKPLFPCLIDATSSNVISFPPITNSETSKISTETKDILVEVTSSTNLASCKKVMEALLTESVQAGLCIAESTAAVDDDKDKGGNNPAKKVTMVVEQMRAYDNSGDLKSVFPSRIDLAISNPLFRVIWPE